MRLINADELKSKFLEMGCMDGKPCYGAEIIDRMPTVKAIPIPDNATNGDVIKAMFPNIIRTGTILSDKRENVIATNVNPYWWDLPYKGSDKE